jgi:ABC-type branched-subunit amino acid transport system substrate-binding protein
MGDFNTRTYTMALHRKTALFDVVLVLAFGVSGAACNSLTKLDEYKVAPATTNADSEPACESNARCTDDATKAAGASDPVAAVCVKGSGRCVPLLSEDCDAITGDYLNEDAIVIGSLFSTQGAQAATNLQRQQSAMLAVTQINDVGGIPWAGGTPRKLVLVSCNETTDLTRAGDHLVGDLRVPAIVGPNTSQDTLDLSASVSVPGGTVVMSPTAVASSVGALLDNDLTWLMVPTDVQRAPLMVSQINALETELKSKRNTSTIKLGIVYRDDALGIGTRTSLNNLKLNGKSLSDPTNLGNHVHISPYQFGAADQAPLVAEYAAFLPDIVVLAGTAEAITQVMVPLEAAWPAGTPRPEYVLIDSVKVPELITAATDSDDLRTRVRGTGITPSPSSTDVYNSFKLDYQVAYPGTTMVSGMGPAYDATYAIAFALAAEQDQPVSGDAVKAGLRKLTGGTMEIDLGPTRVLPAFQKLAQGDKIDAHGTFTSLAWSGDGTVLGGTIEMWCIGTAAGKPGYQSSGLTYDLMTDTQVGEFKPCQ